MLVTKFSTALCGVRGHGTAGHAFVNKIKSQLKEGAKNFHLVEDISDETRVNSKTWKELKSEVCDGEDYKTSQWFIDLPDHEKTLIEDLR